MDAKCKFLFQKAGGLFKFYSYFKICPTLLVLLLLLEVTTFVRCKSILSHLLEAEDNKNGKIYFNLTKCAMYGGILGLWLNTRPMACFCGERQKFKFFKLKEREKEEKEEGDIRNLPRWAVDNPSCCQPLLHCHLLIAELDFRAALESWLVSWNGKQLCLDAGHIQ